MHTKIKIFFKSWEFWIEFCEVRAWFEKTVSWGGRGLKSLTNRSRKKKVVEGLQWTLVVSACPISIGPISNNSIFTLLWRPPLSSSGTERTSKIFIIFYSLTWSIGTWVIMLLFFKPYRYILFFRLKRCILYTLDIDFTVQTNILKLPFSML